MRKICPFMDRCNPRIDTIDLITCKEIRCMAWGVVQQKFLRIDGGIKGKPIFEDEYGCKLIERPE